MDKLMHKCKVKPLQNSSDRTLEKYVNFLSTKKATKWRILTSKPLSSIPIIFLFFYQSTIVIFGQLFIECPLFFKDTFLNDRKQYKMYMIDSTMNLESFLGQFVIWPLRFGSITQKTTVISRVTWQHLESNLGSWMLGDLELEAHHHECYWHLFTNELTGHLTSPSHTKPYQEEVGRDRSR